MICMTALGCRRVRLTLDPRAPGPPTLDAKTNSFSKEKVDDWVKTQFVLFIKRVLIKLSKLHSSESSQF